MTPELLEATRAENAAISEGIENGAPRVVGPVNYSVLAGTVPYADGSHIDGGGIRKDSGKLRFGLLPARALAWIAAVFTGGAAKYAPRNWERGMAWSKHVDALERHLAKWKAGEDLDADSGLPHLAHVGFGVLALLTYAETCPELDDRPKGNPWTHLGDIEALGKLYREKMAEETR